MSLKPSDSARIVTPAPPAQITLSVNQTETATPNPRRPLVLIEGETANVRLDLQDFWTQRELLYFLTWRDIKVRYKQTLMGAAWVIIQPLFTMLIVTFVLGRLAGLDLRRRLPSLVIGVGDIPEIAHPCVDQPE